jgi:integrase
MARSKQGSIVERGKGNKKRIYARIRWTEWDGGKKMKREKFAPVKTRSEGREKIKQMLRELEETGPEIFDGERMTFAQLAARYEKQFLIPAEYAGEQKIAGMRNIKTPKNQLRACKDYFDQRLIRDIDYDDLVTFKRRRSTRVTKRGKTPALATVHRELERLHAVFEYAVRKKWLKQNPFDAGDPLINKADEPLRERMPTAEEAAAIIAQCVGKRAHLRPILTCIRDTGMRPSEMWRAVVADVDFAAHTLTVRAKNSKTGRKRIVGLSAELETELKQLIALGCLQPGDPLFGIKDNVRKSYASACQAAGVSGVTLYSWRHYFTTDTQRAGVSPQIAMKTTGHTEAKTFRRYLIINEDIAHQTASSVEEYRRARTSSDAKGEREGNQEQKEA